MVWSTSTWRFLNLICHIKLPPEATCHQTGWEPRQQARGTQPGSEGTCRGLRGAGVPLERGLETLFQRNGSFFCSRIYRKGGKEGGGGSLYIAKQQKQRRPGVLEWKLWERKSLQDITFP